MPELSAQWANDMQPTMKLRLFKPLGMFKGVPYLVDSYGDSYVLQQWWEGKIYRGAWSSVGEWRDVPVETARDS